LNGSDEFEKAAPDLIFNEAQIQKKYQLDIRTPSSHYCCCAEIKMKEDVKQSSCDFKAELQK